MNKIFNFIKKIPAFIKNDKKILPIIYTFIFFALIIALIIALYGNKENFIPNLKRFAPYWRPILRGFFLTIGLSVAALLFSLIIGFILYIMYISKFKTLHHISNVFTEIIFGTPLIVFLLIIFYLLWLPLGLPANRTVVGFIGLSLYVSPYMKNAFEGAFKSIDALQEQAMTVYGFTTFQKYRYIKIPQILKVILPPLMGNLTFIIKGSALLYVIGVDDLYKSISFVQQRLYAYDEGYLLMLVMYLIITVPLIRLTRWFERRFAL